MSLPDAQYSVLAHSLLHRSSAPIRTFALPLVLVPSSPCALESAPCPRVTVPTCPLAKVHAPSRKRVPTCPLEGFAFAYFLPPGAGISFALAAPMATIFSIIA